ncbi:hypothetical protein SASPL_130248 [Salvia splendens]|uniref:Protein kinase domain-containing protein n=1 Tax=Salvia splendens TaxID=180675 RepID=A0A8X8ZJG4_SALSN|nr:hypothetical protein SASPL_130248 [Salvia splendens]
MSNISKSLEWAFPVDSGFFYLLRFHFFDFLHRKENDMVFTININNQIADTEVDVIFMAGGPDFPIFKDYKTWVPDVGNRGKQDLLLSLVPFLEIRPRYINALLNGLEIFKLNDSVGSFAVSNPELVINSPPVSLEWNHLPAAAKKKKIGVVVGSVISVVVVVAAVAMLIIRRRKVKDKAGTSVTESSLVTLSTRSRSTHDTCRYLSIDEIKAATGNFDDSFVIGRGGFGRVYRGFICNVPVAIKRLNSTSRQGTREYLTEIDVLFKLCHLHLVSLVGYCGDDGEMILVYDYMANGSLRDHLYDSEKSPLTWKQRLQICVGAANGWTTSTAVAPSSTATSSLVTSFSMRNGWPRCRTSASPKWPSPHTSARSSKAAWVMLTQSTTAENS